MNDGTKTVPAKGGHLLRDLQHMVEADGGSAFSPGALAELHMLVDAAIELGMPVDCSGMSPQAAFLLGKLHGEWRELRTWLESVK